jgi:hypothetical protein
MSTKQEINSAEKYRKRVVNMYMSHFLGLLHNALEIENLPDDCPKRYFLRTLFRQGKIAEYGSGDDTLYLSASGIGVDIYGLPTQYVLTGYNGFIVTVDKDDCNILRLNDLEKPIYPYLYIKSELLADFDTAIRQNLEATRTPCVFECKDQATLLSLQNQWKARRVGALVAFNSNSVIENNKLTVHETGAQFYVDKLHEARKEVIDEVYERLGIMTANTDKRERVQSAEVNASVGRVIDNIYVMIDTFNYDAKVSGSKLRMKLNSVTEEYYVNSTTENINVNKESADGSR